MTDVGAADARSVEQLIAHTRTGQRVKYVCLELIPDAPLKRRLQSKLI